MKTHEYVCRYCHEPQRDIYLLREHILVHKNNKEIIYLGGKYKKNASETKKRRGNEQKIQSSRRTKSEAIKKLSTNGIDEPKIENGVDDSIINRMEDFVAKRYKH